MPNHVLRNCYRDVVLSVMHEKTDPAQRQGVLPGDNNVFEYIPNEMGQDSARTRVRFYGGVVGNRFPDVREGNKEGPCILLSNTLIHPAIPRLTFPCGPPRTQDD